MAFDTTQSQIIEAFKEVLLESVEVLTDKNCYLTLYPEVQGDFSDDIFCTISPADSAFPEEFQVGGGQFQCVEDSGIIVKIFSRMKTDRTPYQSDALLQEQRGVLWLKWRILRAMIGINLTVNGNPVLRQLIWARRATAPAIENTHYVSISLDFGVSWDWDLLGQNLTG